jgi:menaquinone-dependent protoporphyrinogen oxidase
LSGRKKDIHAVRGKDVLCMIDSNGYDDFLLKGGTAMGFEDDALWSLRRRDLLALSGRLAAAMSLGVAGTELCHAAQIEFAEGSCGGGEGGPKKALVAYASKYGSTGGVADAIGKELCSKDVAADVRLISNAGELSSYQAVVIGSPVYRGKWLPEAVDFLKKNRDALSRVPVAYFLVCMSLAKPTDKTQAEVLAYMDPILKAVPEIKPVAIGSFAGALHYANLSGLNKTILKSMGTPEGDFRDWAAIRAWARDPLRVKIAR